MSGYDLHTHLAPQPRTTGRRKGERVVITPDWRSSVSGVA
jgi:hypothetical protein